MYKKTLEVTVRRLGMSLYSFEILFEGIAYLINTPQIFLRKLSSHAFVFFTMASKLEEFVSAPSEDLLNDLTKDQQVELAGHYKIYLVSQDKCLKDNIKSLKRS